MQTKYIHIMVKLSQESHISAMRDGPHHFKMLHWYVLYSSLTLALILKTGINTDTDNDTDNDTNINKYIDNDDDSDIDNDTDDNHQ